MTALAASGGAFEAAPLGLIVHGKPSYQECVAYHGNLLALRAMLPWVYGDLLVYIEDVWDEDHADNLIDPDVVGMAYQTLRNWKWVARHVPFSVRTEKSWTHHCYVAHLPPEEQVAWLGRAISEDWNTDDMKVAMIVAGVKQRRVTASERPVARLAESSPAMPEAQAAIASEPAADWPAGLVARVNEQRDNRFEDALKEIAYRAGQLIEWAATARERDMARLIADTASDLWAERKRSC